MRTTVHNEALVRFGQALSDATPTQILLRLRETPGHPADAIGVSRQILSNHLACLRGCGLAVAEPGGAIDMSRLIRGSGGRWKICSDWCWPSIRRAARMWHRVLLMAQTLVMPMRSGPSEPRRRVLAHPDSMAGGRDDLLQRARGDSRARRGQASVLDGLDGVRAGFDDRGVLDGGGRLAVRPRTTVRDQKCKVAAAPEAVPCPGRGGGSLHPTDTQSA